MSDSIYKFTFNADGSCTVDASQAGKGEKEILADLSSLTSDLGGILRVERHRPGIVHRENAGVFIKLKR